MLSKLPCMSFQQDIPFSKQPKYVRGWGLLMFLLKNFVMSCIGHVASRCFSDHRPRSRVTFSWGWSVNVKWLVNFYQWEQVVLAFSGSKVYFVMRWDLTIQLHISNVITIALVLFQMGNWSHISDILTLEIRINTLVFIHVAAYDSKSRKQIVTK